MKKNNTKAIELLKDLIERVRDAKYYPPKAFWKDITDWMDINGLYFESVYRGEGLYGDSIFDNEDGYFFADYTLESRNDSESNGLFKLFELREAQL